MARVTRQLELRGVFASAITPRRKGSQDADFSAALDLLDFLAQGGVQAICVFGATGEFIDYGFSERQRIVYLGVKRSRVPLIAGVSHSTISGALQLADEAVHAGADGLILMPPFFYSYSQCEIEAFYRQFARETGDAVPILLHNLPQATSKLEIDTVRKLLDSGRFAGIKRFERRLAIFRTAPRAQTRAALCALQRRRLHGRACAARRRRWNHLSLRLCDARTLDGTRSPKRQRGTRRSE